MEGEATEDAEYGGAIKRVEVSTVGGMAPADSGITLIRDDEGLLIEEVGLGGPNKRIRLLDDELDDFAEAVSEVLEDE